MSHLKLVPDPVPVWLQQTLDGQVVKHPAPSGTRLGPHEREVLRALSFGSLTSTQAGKICHEIRGHCFSQVPYGQWNSGGYHRSRYGGVNIYPKTHEGYEKTRYQGEGCCPGACLEGTEVMKRLKRRGFVEKIGGLWYAAEAWGKSWMEEQ
jgi:hypothetical protein